MPKIVLLLGLHVFETFLIGFFWCAICSKATERQYMFLCSNCFENWQYWIKTKRWNCECVLFSLVYFDTWVIEINVNVILTSIYFQIKFWIHLPLFGTYHHTSNIRCSLVSNKIVYHSDVSPVGELHIHYRLNTQLQCIGQWQLHGEMRNI